MPQSYYLVRAKLARADQHLNALQASIEGFINSNPYRPIADVDVEAGDSLIRIKVTREPPVLDWGVAIGDVLHNLRSGLDHLVWHLGGDPPPNEDDSEFPIFIDRSNYRRNGIKKVVGVPDYPQAIIEDLQPYHRGDTAHLDPLWQLHRLSNFDKHRLLHVSGAVIQGASYWVEAPAGSSSDFDTIRFGPFEDGAVVARWPLDPSAQVAIPKVDVPFHFVFNIAFDQEGPGRGQPVMEALRRIQRHIGNVVLSRLAPFLF